MRDGALGSAAGERSWRQVASMNSSRLLLQYVPLELNGEHAIGETGADDFHVIGKLKAPLEVAPGDPAAKILRLETRRAVPAPTCR